MSIYTSKFHVLNHVYHNGRGHDELLYFHLITCSKKLISCCMYSCSCKNVTSKLFCTIFSFNISVMKNEITFTILICNITMYMYIPITLSYYLYLYYKFPCNVLAPCSLAQPSSLLPVTHYCIFNST